MQNLTRWKVRKIKTENRIIHDHKPYYVVSVNHKLYLSILKYNQKMIDYDDTVNCVTLEKWHTVLEMGFATEGACYNKRVQYAG